MHGFDALLLALAHAPVATDVAVIAAGAHVHGVDVADVAYLAHGCGVHTRQPALAEPPHVAVAELHLDRAAMDEVQLLLGVVVVKARLDAGRQDDRVDAEGGHAEALADLAKAGPVAQVVEVGDGVAVAFGHARIVSRSLHRVSPVGR